MIAGMLAAYEYTGIQVAQQSTESLMMKNTSSLQYKSFWLIPSILVLLTLSIQWAKTETHTDHTACYKVGIYDSRAVAMAYYRSGEFANVLKDLHAELKEAKKQGNETRVAELNAKGPALQAQAHQQGFGNAPIDEIIQRIEKELPQIAEKAGVGLIISKWNLDYQASDASFVDVTDLMVKPFSPTKETWIVIKDIQKKDPVPLDVLKDHKH